MTKLKNTKKGMAKKALSISLVAAMLATSNVPVWAAEFTDGTDAVVEAPVVEEAVDTFSAEAEAPVVEEETTPATTGSVVEKGDLILEDVTVSDKASFAGGEVKVTGKIHYKTKDSKEAEELKAYNFGWRVQGETAAIFTDVVGEGNTTAKMGFKPDFTGASDKADSQAQYVDWGKYVGKTLELYIFKNQDSTDATKIDPTVIGTTKIEKCDMTGAKLRLSKISSQLVYNGKTFQYTDVDGGANDVSINNDGTSAFISIPSKGDAEPGVSGIWNRETILKYFDVSASQTALNAGEKIQVTATAKADSPYAGTIYADTLEVQKRSYNSDDFVLDVEDGLSYQYTGNHIVIPNEKVSLKEVDTLAGADLSSAIVKAETTTSDLGERTVTVTLDATKMPNFASVATTMKTAKEEVIITKRDLSTNSTAVSLKYGRVPYETTVADFASNHLVFTDKDGTVLKLNDNDYVLSIKDPDNQTVAHTGSFGRVGTYTVTVSAKTTGAPTCLNGQTFDVRVATNVISNVTFDSGYAPYYTGTEIKPTQADLGKITIKNVDSSEPDETLKNDEWEIVGYSENTNASTYNKTGSVKTYAYVKILVKGDSSYAGQTFDVPFEIKPLTVSEDTVTVPKTVTYNKGFGPAKDYNVQLVVTAKDNTGKIVKGLSANDYSIEYIYVDGNANSKAENELHDKIKATITIKNTNFMGKQGKIVEIPMDTKHTEIVEKALTSEMIKFTPDTYTYTGGNIDPEYVVLDGAYPLYENEDYTEVSVTEALNVGKGKVTIKGIENHYYGTASAEFTITPANTSDVKVEFTNLNEMKYTGKIVRPRTFKATLNGNDVTNQFEIVSYGENISGKGTVVLKAVDGNKNFTGSNITVEFDIIKEVVAGTVDVYNSNGQKVTDAYKVEDPEATVTNFNKSAFEFDGTEKTFAEEILTLITPGTKAKVSDFEIKYADNVTGAASKLSNGKTKYNVAYVYVV